MEISNEEYTKLYKLAYKDTLTGCYNRNWLFDYCDKHLNEEYWIGITDLNGLKKTNDFLGHRAGDERIIKLGNSLKPYGRVVRYGGNEFVIIFTNKEKALECEKENEEQYKFSFAIWKKTKNITFEQAFEICDKLMYRMKKGKYNDKYKH